LVQPLWKALGKFLKKLKTELPYNQLISLLSIIYAKLNLNLSLSQDVIKNLTPMLTVAYSQWPSYGNNPDVPMNK
jgi:hypothetical protein